MPIVTKNIVDAGIKADEDVLTGLIEINDSGDALPINNVRIAIPETERARLVPASLLWTNDQRWKLGFAAGGRDTDQLATTVRIPLPVNA